MRIRNKLLKKKEKGKKNEQKNQLSEHQIESGGVHGQISNTEVVNEDLQYGNIYRGLSPHPYYQGATTQLNDDFDKFDDHDDDDREF